MVDNIVHQLKTEISGQDPLTVSEGKIHDYLGMTLDYTTNKTLKVDMINNIDGVLEEAPQDIDGSAITPGTSHLFKVNTMDPVC